jgi:hypothetical protein
VPAEVTTVTRLLALALTVSVLALAALVAREQTQLHSCGPNEYYSTAVEQCLPFGPH